MTLRIEHETPDDRDSIRALVTAAFPTGAEARLVDALRHAGRVALSVVARRDEEVVGHVLFSNAELVEGDRRTPCLALAPMAVVPRTQRAGIGTSLGRRSLEMAREAGHRIVVVLGHPEYYPRFGFSPASAFGIRCPYDAPDEAFLALELVDGALEDAGGMMTYAPEFDSI